MVERDSQDRLDLVAGLLQTATIGGINYLEVAMQRKPDSPPVAPDLVFPARLELGYQIINGQGIAYQLTAVVDRPDLVARTSVAILYLLQDVTIFENDPEVAQVFGERIAMPAVYPYARSKIMDITSDAGVPPVVLSILDMTRVGSMAQRPQVQSPAKTGA